MASVNPEFWHERWQRGDIGFHQPQVHDMLVRNWVRLGIPAESRIFTPLCGKSLDMAWLAREGYSVIGVELSPIAVEAFFAERGLRPERQSRGTHSVLSAEPYELWCGDFFTLPAEAVAKCAAVYDRASLVAFPPDLQPAYAEKLSAILPQAAAVAVVGLDFDGTVFTGPPFPTPRHWIDGIFGSRFDIHVLEQRDGLAESPNLKNRGLTWLEETLYLLRRK